MQARITGDVSGRIIGMSEFGGALRGEIVESQKARIDLLKWKIILIAALGALGLGVGKDAGTGFPSLLGLIPLVCAYVDVVCVHNDLRILVIAAFIRSGSDPDAKRYEEMCERERWTFFLETFSLVGTTVAFSMFVFVIARVPSLMQGLFPSGQAWSVNAPVAELLQIAAGLGFAVSVFASVFKMWRLKHL
jgi:hypothetical protein